MLYVLIYVGTRTARPLRTMAREPYALTLMEFFALKEIERFEATRTEGDRIDAGYMTAIAFNDPARLEQINVRWRERAGLLESRDERLKRAQKQFAEIAKLSPISSTP